MPRQNPALAAAQQRSGDGLGPIYRHLLGRQREMQRRFGVVGTVRRPTFLLDALEAGETVTVSSWRVPVHMRTPGCGGTLVIDPGM